MARSENLPSEDKRKLILSEIAEALDAGRPDQPAEDLPLAPDFTTVLERLRRVFTASEVARAIGVKERQIHRWTAGEQNPQGEARDGLLLLAYVLSRLETAHELDEIKVWFWSPQASLGGSCPLEAIEDGRAIEVRALAAEIANRREPSDSHLARLAGEGDAAAYDALLARYRPFVVQKAGSYVLLGGTAEDLIQEGLVGLYKAIRDFRPDRESSFRNFAELCITRQVVTAVKTASRMKHAPLNQSVSVSEEQLPGSWAYDPSSRVISATDLQSLIETLTDSLSELEGRTLSLYLEGRSYDEMAELLSVDPKTVHNALQRVKRKVVAHIDSRGDGMSR